MTRTERNQYPAALLRDRKSRSGLTAQSEMMRKNGAGAHNWGSYAQEGEFEAQANQDAEAESNGLENLDDFDTDKLEGENEHDNGSLDSASSAESMSGKVPVLAGRRMSNVSDEERERARVYREGVLGKGPIDLAHIAKTSYGIAQSPPNASILGTSPTQTKHFAMKQ